MSRITVGLTLDHLDALDAPCRSCAFWELDPVRRGRLADATAVAAEKDAWVSEVLREWGSCGRVALVEGRPVGHLLYAPAAFLPGTAGFPTAPPSPDAVVLTTVYVDPLHAGRGLGRMLVQGMARDLIQRGGIRAVEAFGTTWRRGGIRPTAPCQAPVEFLSSVGFKTQRSHPDSPRMRMDLRSALTWKDEVEAALERLVGVVRPARKPTPESSRTTRESGPK